MKRSAEGFGTTLTLVCSAFGGVLAFAYSFIQSALASPLIGTSLTAELHAYSFPKLGVSYRLAGIVLCLFLGLWSHSGSSPSITSATRCTVNHLTNRANRWPLHHFASDDLSSFTGSKA